MAQETVSPKQKKYSEMSKDEIKEVLRASLGNVLVTSSLRKDPLLIGKHTADVENEVVTS